MILNTGPVFGEMGHIPPRHKAARSAREFIPSKEALNSRYTGI
jgi:hypothetical protein